jgi:hypothetical protein
MRYPGTADRAWDHADSGVWVSIWDVSWAPQPITSQRMAVFLFLASSSRLLLEWAILSCALS